MAEISRAGAAFEAVKHSALLRQWSKSTAAFTYGAPLISADELDANALKPYPDREDVRWIMGRLDTAATDEPEDQIIWKSRQHFATHTVHAADLWLCAFHPYRSIAYVAQEEQEGKDHIEEKVVGMWERTPKWFRAHYDWSFKAGTFVIESRGGEPHRSYIEPIARGSRKLRSWTYSRIVWDEAAHNDQLKEGYTGAYATVRGSRDPKTGKIKKGQIVLLSSAAHHPFMIELSGSALEGGIDLARAR